MEATHNLRPATVCLIGVFPPTSGGPGLVNEAFKRMSEEAGAKVITIDLSPRPGPATWLSRAARIPKVMVGIPRLTLVLLRLKASAVYLGLAGGFGQLYDIAFVSLARALGGRLFLHHHSYAYLGKRGLVTATLVRVAGPSATHIVLCEHMKKRLTDLYGGRLRVVVISNITNTHSPTNRPQVRTKLRTIGFISHLTRSKGVLEFVDVAERISSKLPDVRALLAGSIEERSLVPIISRRLRGTPSITYMGAVFGKELSRFYADIDALVFPTRYANEADPRVINEALAHGVVVVTLDRGCIKSVVAAGGGVVLSDDADFVAEAERLLLDWYQDPAGFSSISSAALANAADLQSKHEPRLRALINELVSRPHPSAATPFSTAPPRNDESHADESHE